ncbi:MAG: indole-3-glycerol phosphate synthase [Actinomycetota bacterium]|jgi:indole-3-glycerol phosphate synthase|nr:indole-3-glycerol phosphate synthase [Actinomycetota bacterium]
MGFLSDLTTVIRRDIAASPLDVTTLAAQADAAMPPRSLTAALRGRTPAIIAEIKRSSPSAGAIADADPRAQARAYADAGASAVSVLTEAHHFNGSLEDLRAVRTVIDLPLLRKDFLVDPSQVTEARAAGADAVLLITACLSDAELVAMLEAARGWGMDALVETHSARDLERALATNAELIGVNARDLETLEVDATRALAQLARIPADRVAVMESGISTRAQVVAAVAAGASGILVGEALMRADDPRAELRRLTGEEDD